MNASNWNPRNIPDLVGEYQREARRARVLAAKKTYLAAPVCEVCGGKHAEEKHTP